MEGHLACVRGARNRTQKARLNEEEEALNDCQWNKFEQWEEGGQTIGPDR
jgi:hypothetical protein